MSRLTTFLVLRVLMALGHLAPDTACRLGGGLGVLAFHLRVRRRVATCMVQRGVGLAGPARAKVLRRSYASMGANFLEVWSAGRPGGIGTGLTVLNPRWMGAMHRRHPGCVLVMPHLGSWDLAAYAMGRIFTVLSYAKVQHNLAVDRLLNQRRTALGQTILLTGQGDRTAAVRALRALRSGQALALLADQRPSKDEAEAARFLGQPAWCHSGPAFFARRAGVPLMGGCCLRIRAGRSVMVVGRPWTPAAEVPTSVVTQQVMDHLTSWIRAHPGQYFWQHRRFRGDEPTMADIAGSDGASIAAIRGERMEPPPTSAILGMSEASTPRPRDPATPRP